MVTFNTNSKQNTMKYFYVFLITVFSYFLKGQCTMSMTVPITPPTCSTCCNGSATVTAASCPILSYTWVPGATTGSSAANLCAGTTYTIYAYVQSTVCCGTPVATSTVFIPAAPTSVVEINEIKNIIVSPNPSNGGITISTNGIIDYSVQIIIHDINGKVVFDKYSILNNNSSAVYLDAKAGIYFVTIMDRETQQRIVKKIVVEK